MNLDWQRRLASIVPIALVGIFFLTFFGWVTAQRDLTHANAYGLQCQSRYNKATQVRSDLLNIYVQQQAAAVEREHDAMFVLVSVRGEPNSVTSDEAKTEWLAAYQDVKKANWLLMEARRLNPVPQFSDFCKAVKGVKAPKVPPAITPSPSPSPDAR